MCRCLEIEPCRSFVGGTSDTGATPSRARPRMRDLLGGDASATLPNAKKEHYHALKVIFPPDTAEQPMKTLVLESTSPFQGLPELVAYDEGLFEREGIKIEWADRDEAGVKATESLVASPKGVNPFGSHGKLVEEGKADMYNACEWGNYCRVQDTVIGSRQIGRRGIVTYAAIVVRPDSPVYTPHQLANRPAGLPFYAGPHSAPRHLLAGFRPAEAIKA